MPLLNKFDAIEKDDSKLEEPIFQVSFIKFI